MKKVCDYIDNNYKLCLILFAVVFVISTCFTPVISSQYNDALTYLFPTCFYSSSIFFTDFGFVAFLSIGLLIGIVCLIIVTLTIKTNIKWIFIVLSCISLIMLILTFFMIIWLITNFPYDTLNSDLSRYFITFLPSEIGFTLCSFFSISYAIHKFKQ